MLLLLAIGSVVAFKPYLIKMNTDNLAMIALPSTGRIRMSKRSDIDSQNQKTIAFFEEVDRYVYINFCGKYLSSKTTDPGIILGEKGVLSHWEMVNVPGGGFRLEQRGMCLVLMDTSDQDGNYMNLQPCDSRWINVFERIPLGSLPYSVVCGGLDNACLQAGYIPAPRVVTYDKNGNVVCTPENNIYGLNRGIPINGNYDPYNNGFNPESSLNLSNEHMYPYGGNDPYGGSNPYYKKPGYSLYGLPDPSGKRVFATNDGPLSQNYDPTRLPEAQLYPDGQVRGPMLNDVYTGPPRTSPYGSMGRKDIVEAGHYIQYDKHLVTYPDKSSDGHSVQAVSRGV